MLPATPALLSAGQTASASLQTQPQSGRGLFTLTVTLISKVKNLAGCCALSSTHSFHFKLQRSLAKNLETGLLGKLVLAQHSIYTLPHKLMWALSRLAGAKRFVPVQSTVASLTTAAPAKPAHSLGLRALLAVPVAAFAGWIVSDKDRAVLAVALPTRFVRVVATAATITLGATGLAQRVGCQVVMNSEPAPYTLIGVQERQQVHMFTVTSLRCMR